MDLKLILIILVLVGIIYIIKELTTIKKNNLNLIEIVDNSIVNNIKALKNRLNVVTSEIKNYNNDLVIQIKKINSINSQVVTSMSNYYTESESDGNKNLIEYLSDAKKTDTEFKINFSENKTNKINKNNSEKKQDRKQDINSQKSIKSKTSETQSILPSIPLIIASDNISTTSIFSKDNLINNNQSLIIGEEKKTEEEEVVEVEVEVEEVEVEEVEEVEVEEVEEAEEVDVSKFDIVEIDDKEYYVDLDNNIIDKETLVVVGKITDDGDAIFNDE